MSIEDLIKRTSLVCERLKVAVSAQTFILEAVLQSCRVHLEPPLSETTVTRLRSEAIEPEIGIKIELPEESLEPDPLTAGHLEIQHLTNMDETDVPDLYPDSDADASDPYFMEPDPDENNLFENENFNIKTERKCLNPIKSESLDVKEEPPVKKKRQRKSKVKTEKETRDYPCDQCPYVAGRPSRLKEHIENCHQGPRFFCHECEFAAKTKSHLMHHRRVKHDNVRYPCDQCSSYFTTRPNLKKHIQTTHEGIRLMCDQCDWTTDNKRYLKQHHLSAHEGVVYPCDKCDFVATRPLGLKYHNDIKHLGIKFRCNYDGCNYEGSKKALYKHKTAKHKKLLLKCDD